MPVDEIPLPPGLTTVDFAAVKLKTSVRNVQRWIVAGLLPAVVLGSGNRTVYLVRVADVKRFQKPVQGYPTGRPRKPGGKKP